MRSEFPTLFFGRPTDGLINMERARRASAAAAHAAWEALRGRAPAVADNPLGADDVDVVDSDDEIVVEDDAADDAEGSDADEAAEGGS